MDKGMLNKLINIYENAEDILINIAEDLKTDARILIKLSKLTDSVISAVQLHPNTPSYILEKWLDMSANEQERVHIVYNPSLRMEVLKKIIKADSSQEVREAALVAFVMRRTKDAKISSEELLKLYGKINDRRLIKTKQRRDAAKELLFKHPKFPIKALKRLKNKK